MNELEFRPVPSLHVDGTHFNRTSLGLWVPADSDRAASHTHLPLLVAEQMNPHQGSLLVAGKRPEPSDGKAYFTEEEIDPTRGITPLSRDDVLAMLAALPREPTVVILAGLLKRLSKIGYEARDQLALATEIYGDAPVVSDMAKFCSERDHVIFSEQGFFSLLAHAVVHCAPVTGQELGDEESEILKRLLLGAPALLHQDDELEEYDSDAPEELLAYLTQNLLFNAHANFGNGLARTWHTFQGIGLDPSHPWTSPIALDELLASSPMSLQQQCGLAFGLYSILLSDEATIVQEAHWRDICEQVAPDTDPFDAIGLISSTFDDMRAQLAGDDARKLDPLLRWASVPFLERPFLRLSDERLLLVSPHALESWPVDGVHYRLLRQARSADRRKGAQHFTALAGELTETYVAELVAGEVERCAQEHLNLGRVERAMAMADGESSDLFIMNGRDLVVLEISSSRITALTRLSGDQHSLRDDLEKTVTKRINQLDRTVAAIKSGELRPCDADPAEISRIFPVIVNVEPVRWTPPLHAYLRNTVPDLLQQTGVQPLQFLDIEELEAVLSVLGPASFAELIAAKIVAAGVDPDFQTWFHNDATAPKPGRPPMVQGWLNDLFAAVTSLFNQKSSSEPPAAT